MSKKANLIVFSLTTPVSLLIEIIDATKQNNSPTLCLSPHKLFDTEIASINQKTTKEIYFISLYEFISQNEMEYCDTEADDIITSEKKTRDNQLVNYYAKIKELKNNIILKNIELEYQLELKYVLSNDLGIDAPVWISNNFNQEFFLNLSKVAISNNFIEKTKSALRYLIKNNEIHLFETKDEKFYFFGRFSRITQYLDAEKYKIIQLSKWEVIYLNSLLKLCRLSNKQSILMSGLISSFLLKTFIRLFKVIKSKKSLDIASTLHEGNEIYKSLALKMGVQILYIQDGFLPSYYTSKYLYYDLLADKYLVWDQLSKGLFKRHSLNCKIWTCYKETTLPIIENTKFQVQQIVFLASGSGNWTALKNRSDEDLSFLTFVEAAKNFPDINFIYRPHPLWMHPTHQGLNSIKRIIDYSKKLNLANFTVSSGAFKEGLMFAQGKQLSVKPTTINDDINSADIVFGDHSQALITAMQRKKIIASVSCANRKEFFYDYTKLGFPILRSSEDMISFIKKVKVEPYFIDDYNKSIKLYNDKYTR